MTEEKLKRMSPAVIPTGFRIATSPDLVFVDLIDKPADENGRIFFTLALTKDMAKSLTTALKEFIEE